MVIHGVYLRFFGKSDTILSRSRLSSSTASFKCVISASRNWRRWCCVELFAGTVLLSLAHLRLWSREGVFGVCEGSVFGANVGRESLCTFRAGKVLNGVKEYVKDCS